MKRSWCLRTVPCDGFRLWKKLHKHEEFIPSIPIEQAIAEDHVSFMRWQVHREWILQVNLIIIYISLASTLPQHTTHRAIPIEQTISEELVSLMRWTSR